MDAIRAGRSRAWVAGSLAGVILVSAACGGSGVGGEFDQGVVEDLDAAVEGAVEQTEGGVVARVEGPTGQRTMAAGPAGLDSGQVTGDDAFRIGSITKLFTATVAMQLVEDDIVDLDTPVARWVPERAALFEYGDDLTLRQLLSHTAGLPEFLAAGSAYELDLIERGDVADGVVVVDCDAVADLDPLEYAADGEASFEPGSGQEYSNTNFWLAGEVLVAATGQPLEQLFRDRILDPLDMNATWLDCAEEPRSDLAHGLHPAGASGIRLPAQGDELFDVTRLLRDARAAGGLVSTAGDLTVFAQALFSEELFDDDASLEEMLETEPDATRGLGLTRGNDSGRDIVGHDGMLPGYNSQLRYDLDRGVAIVALNNETPAAGGPLTTHLTDQISRVLPPTDQGN